MPKRYGLVLFGAFSGAKIADNSLALYLRTACGNDKSYFITKNRAELSKALPDGKFPVLAQSPLGVWLQLRAEKVYYSHSVFDFTSPLIVGAFITCLQHGFPVKRGGSATRNSGSVSSFRKLLIEKLIPYSYYYFCHEVWTPPGIFAENTRAVFQLGSPSIKEQRPPRLELVHLKPETGKILFAPTHMTAVDFGQRVEEWGLISEESPVAKCLHENSLTLALRPHPIDADSASQLPLIQNVLLDTTDNVHDTLGDYEFLITDVSSLGFDALELDIPVRFVLSDFEKFAEDEIGIFENVFPLIYELASPSLSGAIEDVLLRGN